MALAAARAAEASVETAALHATRSCLEGSGNWLVNGDVCATGDDHGVAGGCSVLVLREGARAKNDSVQQDYGARRGQHCQRELIRFHFRLEAH